jgi:chromate transporter
MDAQDGPQGHVAPAHSVTFGEALKVWWRVALLSFGGPAGQIAVMHRILVQEKHWVSENRFLHALNYCMLLPGPEAQQLATYIGWLLHRTRGGLVAGTLFVLPGFISILALSYLYAGYGDVPAVQGLFYGLAPAVLAIVVHAVIRIGRRALRNKVMVAIAAAAFIGIFFLQVPFPAIVLGAAAVGFIGGRVRPQTFSVIALHGTPDVTAGRGPAINDDAEAHTKPSLARAARVSAVWLTLWFGPIVVLLAALGWHHVYVQEAMFFSKAAVVTFGGAYAVLAYMGQQAVEVYGWLGPGEMLHGLGMAETTPGPLIQVVQFVGFMGAYRDPGPLHPMVAGTLAAVLTTWVTFIPCFLWIFMGAPYIEHMRGNRLLTAALSGITAAVVGVILNLAVWFAAHTVFAEVRELRGWGARLLLPAWTTADPAALVLAVAAFAGLFLFKQGMGRTLAACTAAGFAYFMACRAWQ